MDNYNLTEQDFEFLMELQHEMLTQDNVCQAAPRFWVVEDTRSVATAEEYADGYEIFDDNACEVVSPDMEDFIRHINEEYGHEGVAVYYDNGDAILAIFSRAVEDADTLESLYEDGVFTGHDRNGDSVDLYDYLDIETLVDELNDLPFIHAQFRVVYTREEQFIAPNTMFLTNRSAKEHIKANYYHYHKDAHSYAMTAWRSPEVERLWEILDKINWKQLKEDVYGGKQA